MRKRIGQFYGVHVSLQSALAACLILFGPQDIHAQTLQNPRDAVLRLSSDIRSLSDSEPAVLRIDTQLRLAGALGRLYPRISADLLYAIPSQLGELHNRDLEDSIRLQVVKAWIPINLTSAVSFAHSMPARSTYVDYKARAFDTVVSAAVVGDRTLATDIINDALRDNVINLSLLQERLHEYVFVSDYGQALATFDLLLKSFPTRNATDTDVLQLISCTRELATVSSPLVARSVSLMVEAVNEPHFNALSTQHITASMKINGKITETESTKATLLTQIAALASYVNDDSVGKYKHLLSQYGFNGNSAGDADALVASDPPVVTYTHNTTSSEPSYPDRPALTQQMLALPPESALSVVRAASSVNTQGALYASFLRRPDLSDYLRDIGQEEALSAAEHMEDGDTKEGLLDVLLRSFLDKGKTREASVSLDTLAAMGSRFCSANWSLPANNFQWRRCLSLYEGTASYLAKTPTAARLIIKDPGLIDRLALARLSFQVSKLTRRRTS